MGSCGAYDLLKISLPAGKPLAAQGLSTCCWNEPHPFCRVTRLGMLFEVQLQIV